MNSKLRKPESDSVLGKLITSRLEELERNQPWLARKLVMTTSGVNTLIKGRYKPSKRTILLISIILEIKYDSLMNALNADGEEKRNDMDNSKRSRKIS